MEIAKDLSRKLLSGKIKTYTPYSNVTEEAWTRRVLAVLYLASKRKGSTIEFYSHKRSHYYITLDDGFKLEFQVY